jgi:histidinol-phosphate aminotransferase
LSEAQVYNLFRQSIRILAMPIRDRLSFIRHDLTRLAAYTPHPGGETTHAVDRLDTNESPLDLPETIKDELTGLYRETIEANRYPDGSHFKLKAAICNYVKESANNPIEITPDWISVGNGSDELIRSLLIATCLGGEGSILVANPTFSMYGILAQTLGIPIISIERNPQDWSIDLSAASQAISDTNQPPIRVIFVVHPNSPTANVLQASEIEWLRQLSEDILVVIDEAYFEFSQASLVRELSRHPNWIVLRTFSKAFRLAAHRVGYAIAEPNLIAILEKVRLPYNLPSFSQAAALIALEQRSILLPLVTQIRQERTRMAKILADIPQLDVWQSQANFFYLRLKDMTPDLATSKLDRITQTLKDRGTLIRHTGGGLRITIGTQEENNRTLERLKASLLIL